jgi:hypothetical protein
MNPDLWSEALSFLLDGFGIGMLLGLAAALILS